MKFLFWNIKKNPVGPILSNIVQTHNIDIVILAECRDPGVILVDLNDASDNQVYLPDTPGPRVVIYTRFPRKHIETAYSDDFLTVRLSPCRFNLYYWRPYTFQANILKRTQKNTSRW